MFGESLPNRLRQTASTSAREDDLDMVGSKPMDAAGDREVGTAGPDGGTGELSFGVPELVLDEVCVGRARTFALELTNASAISVGPLNTRVVSDLPGGFSIVQDGCAGTSLAGGTGCLMQMELLPGVVDVAFTPTAPGARSTTLLFRVGGLCGGSGTANLWGTATSSP